MISLYLIWHAILTLSLSLSLGNATVIARIKEGYLIWIDISRHIPRDNRYTIGVKIENKFLDLLENIYITYFTSSEAKKIKISECILMLDTLKFIISISWEAKLIPNSHFETILLKLDEVGKILGGWKKSLDNQIKKNRTL